MSATDTLEAVAELLPPERKLRFLAMAARFRSVPEDDEYLQMLEAVGLMTLLWKEVPREIRRILAGATPAEGSQEGLAELLKDAVRESVPSYDDLKQIVQRLEAHEQLLMRATRGTQPQQRAHFDMGRCALYTGLGAALALGIPELLTRFGA
ncbi:hypothetical protein HNR46_004115 [Haloferula luteola]|uniref:Uncharacterized protein n=1 Tax=Haloferula luteola TaxID=595692 RepID=A0A840VMJ5_9BACT|nr:hypothetical protein [Haloferula luteola]MBB5353851.1 hypothetical protein [Haloferula luteola]